MTYLLGQGGRQGTQGQAGSRRAGIRAGERRRQRQQQDPIVKHALANLSCLPILGADMQRTASDGGGAGAPRPAALATP